MQVKKWHILNIPAWMGNTLLKKFHHSRTEIEIYWWQKTKGDRFRAVGLAQEWAFLTRETQLPDRAKVQLKEENARGI